MQYSSIFHKTGPTDVVYPSRAPNFRSLKVFSEVSKNQHHTNLRSKCNPSPVSFSNFSFLSRVLVKSLLAESHFFHGNPVFGFKCTPCIICYQATKTVGIFHILQLFLICLNLCWDWLLQITVVRPRRSKCYRSCYRLDT